MDVLFALLVSGVWWVPGSNLDIGNRYLHLEAATQITFLTVNRVKLPTETLFVQEFCLSL